ncbi:MAG: hypothetical protein QXH53_03240 [Nitrososphaerales archaeon]
MQKIIDLISIETKRSKEKVIKWLRGNSFNVLFIDLPINWQTLLDNVMHGIDLNYVIENMKSKDIIKEPYDTHTLKVYQPIFKVLPFLHKAGVKVFCYRDELSYKASYELINEILIMTLHARLGKINPEKWKELIKEDVRLSLESCKKEGEYIITRIDKVNVCLDASEDLLKYLKNAGCEIERVELDQACKPLDILRRKIRDEILYGIKVSNEEVIKLVEDHVKFTELLLINDFDNAYEIWRKLNKLSTL